MLRWAATLMKPVSRGPKACRQTGAEMTETRRILANNIQAILPNLQRKLNDSNHSQRNISTYLLLNLELRRGSAEWCA
jgi:hypothetical protein